MTASTDDLLPEEIKHGLALVHAFHLAITELVHEKRGLMKSEARVRDSLAVDMALEATRDIMCERLLAGDWQMELLSMADHALITHQLSEKFKMNDRKLRVISLQVMDALGSYFTGYYGSPQSYSATWRRVHAALVTEELHPKQVGKLSDNRAALYNYLYLASTPQEWNAVIANEIRLLKLFRPRKPEFKEYLESLELSEDTGVSIATFAASMVDIRKVIWPET